MTSAKQIYLGSRRGPALPYDAEVEYIESTGTQWIDTGFAPTSQSKVECNAIWLLSASGSGSNQNPTLFGARNTSPAAYFEVLQDANKNLYYQYGSRSPRVSFVYGTRIVYTADANKLYVDGALKITATAATFSIAHPLALFALNKGGVVERFSKASVYGFKAWDANGALARDFKPVRFTNELGQSEGAMYDRVSGQLFRNSGTGVFGFGTDIAGGGYKWLGYSPWRFSRFSRLWKEAA